MTSRGVQTQLTEEAKAWKLAAVRTLSTFDDSSYAASEARRASFAVVALADAYLALNERLMVAWTEDEYFQDRERLLAVVEAARWIMDNAFVNAHTDGGLTAEVEASAWTALRKSLAAVSVGSPETRETEE